MQEDKQPVIVMLHYYYTKRDFPTFNGPFHENMIIDVDIDRKHLTMNLHLSQLI